MCMFWMLLAPCRSPPSPSQCHPSYIPPVHNKSVDLSIGQRFHKNVTAKWYGRIFESYMRWLKNCWSFSLTKLMEICSKPLYSKISKPAMSSTAQKLAFFFESGDIQHTQCQVLVTTSWARSYWSATKIHGAHVTSELNLLSTFVKYH